MSSKWRKSHALACPSARPTLSQHSSNPKLLPWLMMCANYRCSGLTHFRLVKFCHNTRLSYLNRNLPPAVMRNTLCGLQTVDTANAMEVLRRGTDTDSHDPSTRFLCDKWNDVERQWHIRTVQIAHHLGSLGLTPQCASGIAAFHSTARFVG